ncbi:unnamed protein product, partial [Timema podura]|nr:unnamed protein product [Timema podura]
MTCNQSRDDVKPFHVKPLTARILTKVSPLIADQRYEVSCESAGSRPPADHHVVQGQAAAAQGQGGDLLPVGATSKDEETRENVTVSDLSFIPGTEDDGKSITCRAENPNITHGYLEASWKIDVVYPPIVTLRLGSTLNPDDIKEGDDVYFECHVKANPPWRKLNWMHN